MTKGATPQPSQFVSPDIYAGWSWPTPQDDHWHHYRADWDPARRTLTVRADGKVTESHFRGECAFTSGGRTCLMFLLPWKKFRRLRREYKPSLVVSERHPSGLSERGVKAVREGLRLLRGGR